MGRTACRGQGLRSGRDSHHQCCVLSRESTPVQQLNRQCEPPPKGGGREVAHITEGQIADECGGMVQCLGILLHQQCGKEEAWQHGGRGRQIGSQPLLSMNHIGEDGQCWCQLDLRVGREAVT